MIRLSKSMLLTLIVAIVALCSSYNLFSQTGKLARHDAKDFSFGLKAGLNVATEVIIENYNFDIKNRS